MRMAKTHSRYICQSCAYESARWVGRCPNCGEWNSFVEELIPGKQKTVRAMGVSGAGVAVPLSDVDIVAEPRMAVGIPEFAAGSSLVLSCLWGVTPESANRR